MFCQQRAMRLFKYTILSREASSLCKDATEIYTCHEATRRYTCHEATRRYTCHEATQRYTCYEATHRYTCHEATRRCICHEALSGCIRHEALQLKNLETQRKNPVFSLGYRLFQRHKNNKIIIYNLSPSFHVYSSENFLLLDHSGKHDTSRYWLIRPCRTLSDSM